MTAQKRVERLQDVPAAVSVLNTGALASTNKSRLRDYFDSVPGFQASPYPGGGGQQTLIIRGVTSGALQNPTVGIMIDEVPFGATTYDFSPEVDPSDLQRIEVLRGPQGTLYGASSLGGLVKFVTIDPSTTEASGKFEGGLSNINHGDGIGYSVRGSVNLPLSDVFAVRVSGFTRKDPGYIDNPVLGRKDVNDFYVTGGRISALWKIQDDLSVKLTALYQRSVAEGQGEEVQGFGLGQYQTNYVLDTGQTTKTLQSYSGTIRAGLGAIDLTSVTAYSVFRVTASQDYTNIAPWGTLARTYFGASAIGAPSRLRGSVERFTQEIRGTFKTGAMVDWLIGGFFSNEDALFQQAITGQNAAGATLGNIFTNEQPINFREIAAFVDPTVHFTDRLSLQLGARYSAQTANYREVRQGGAIYAAPIVLAAITRSDDVFTYLVTPQFRVNKNLMIYGRVATGYRPGKSNSGNPDLSIPRVADADTTTNYELGIKGNVFDNVLEFDGSIYRIDWDAVQISSIAPSNNLAFISNAARGRSQGGEFSVTVRPGAGLKFGGWISINDSELTQGIVNAATYAPAGARLPFTPKFTANLSVDQAFEISDDLKGTVGVSFSHVGDRQGTFVSSAARAAYPAYNNFDLNFGLTSGSWGFNAYVRNIGDERGLIGGGPGSYPPVAYVYIQPRSIGASLTKQF